jgi:hypothetical protein
MSEFKKGVMAGVIFTLVFAWTAIFFSGPIIDDFCVLTKTKTHGAVIGKRGDVVTYEKGTRLVRAECSEFSRTIFLRDVKRAQSFRKAVGPS